ncbi:MAG TPA: M28 family peptidase [Fimbriiglobus sp.]|nr:M28 family peptidase [Fimbriiglobus sp.]
MCARIARSLLLALPFVAGSVALAQAPATRPASEAAPKPRAVATVSAAAELDQKIIADVKSHSELMKNLQYISDVIGPRLTGSKNLDKASHWTAEKMKEYGLEHVRLEPWEIPVGWERGYARMKLVEPANGRTISVASSGWTPGTKGKVTGRVVALQARTKADLEKYKGKLKDAVVLLGAPGEMQPITDLSYFGMRPDQPLDKSAGRRPSFAPKKEEAKDGAKKELPKKLELKSAELPLPPPPVAVGAEPPKKAEVRKAEPKKEQPPAGRRPGGFGRGFSFRGIVTEFATAEGAAAILSQSSKPHGLIAVSGSWRGRDRGEKQEGTAQLVCAYGNYGMLWRLASDPQREVKVDLDVSNKFIPGPITVYNTVGEITGSEKPDEFVVIGAHLDSWDLGQGTTDNGTGSCVILECARILGELARQGVRPKRTIRFVLYTGEEEGLHGSRQYVQRHKDEMPRTSLALVHDTGTGRVKGFALMGREAVRAVLEPELASLAEVGFEGLSLRFFGGSDHQSFEGSGVPGFACIQEPDEYRLTHHTQTDTFDKAKEPNLIQGAQVMAVTALRVANLPELLPRDRPERTDGRRGEFPRKKN